VILAHKNTCASYPKGSLATNQEKTEEKMVNPSSLKNAVKMGVVMCNIFSALILLVGCQEEHPNCKN